VPVVTAEGGARQLVLHRVIELAEAGAQLPATIALNVPRPADARRDLVAPAEADRVGNLDAVEFGRERRQEFVFKAKTRSDGHARVNLPGILEIEAVVAAARLRVVADAIFPNVVAVVTAHVVEAAARETFAPVEVEAAIRVVVLNVVGDAVERIAALEGVLLP